MTARQKQLDTEARHLSPPEFKLLLSDDEASDEFRAAASHLDECDACRSTLTSHAADESWWSDAHTLLSGASEPRWQPDLSAAALSGDQSPHDSAAVERAVRELLGKPHHPEMFGRLGRYDIEGVIGHGGMGIVVKAHDTELNRPIAIKLLAGHLAHVGAARERFAREGRAAAAVVHEHVVAIYNVESNDRVPYLVMQYVPGRSLQARVDDDGPLSAEEILRIGMQAASGLAAAHRQGLVHRDVKPSNILLEDTVERAVLTDFGLARTFDDASLTHTGILAGTPHYMSPEQATGEPIDQRSDLFSLGAVLYFMATGHPPFRAASAMAVLHRICHDTHRPVWQHNREIPDAISDVIDRLLEKKPGKRFSTADEVQQHLAGLLSRLQQHGLGRRRFRAFKNRRLTRYLLTAAGTIVLAATAITTGISIWPSHAPAPQPQLQTSTAPATTTAETDPSDTTESRRAIIEMQVDLNNNLQKARSEFSAQSTDSYYLQQNDDPWQRDVNTLNRDIKTLETNR